MNSARSLGTVVICAGVLAGFAALPAAAIAESDQFASPTGKTTGSCRLATSPCSLPHAADQASSRDTIILAAGTYNVPAGIAPQQNVSIVGAPGSRPVINFGNFTLDQITAAHSYAVAALDVWSSHLRNLKITGTSSTAPVLNFDDTTVGGGTTRGFLDGVEVVGGGSFTTAYLMGTVRNSIVRSATSDFTAVGVGNLINSTVVNSRADGTAFKAATTRAPAAFEQFYRRLWVRNSIVRGGSSGQDLVTAGPDLSVDWSNFVSLARITRTTEGSAAAVSLGTHNSTTAPGFASSTDLHLTPASPLLDAGAKASTLGLAISLVMPITDLGASDVFGNTRIRAGAPTSTTALPDVGAAEYQPAAPSITGLSVSPTVLKAGRTATLRMGLSANATITVLVQRLQGSKATTVKTQVAKSNAGTVSIPVTMTSRYGKLPTGRYRFSLTAVGVDGTSAKAVYTPAGDLT